MTISSIVRGALQARALTVSNFPDSVSYEGVMPNGKPFAPVIGTPYARLTLVPGDIRSPTVNNTLYRHEGLFQVSLFYPPKGTKTIEDMGDLVRAKFPIGLRIPTNQYRLLITSSRRFAIIEEPDWLHCPVTIGWRIYSAEP